MRRFSERIAPSVDRILGRTSGRTFGAVLVSSGLLCGAASLAGCEQLDGRNRNVQGLRLFRETQFIEAAAQFQKALTEVDDAPVIHYNLGLAYSKVTKPGYDGHVWLGQQGDFVCQTIPGVKVENAGACVKEGDRHYAECGASKTAPLEKELADLKAKLAAATEDDKKKELKAEIEEKQTNLDHYTCSSSFHCVEGSFCYLTSPEIADLAAQHFQIWLKAQPSDAEIKKQLTLASAELDDAKKSGNQSEIGRAQARLDELGTKDLIRSLMTGLWQDSDQYPKAIAYWEGLLKDKPNDAAIMGNLAGIEGKAGNWRKSIEWYNRVAEVTSDPSSKVYTYQHIGDLTWHKLNSRTLIGAETIELADRGIGALQRAAEIQPKNPKWVSGQASIYNFRSTAQSASWAAAIDRASQQELSKQTHVLAEEAKKAQEQPTGAPATPGTPAGTATTPGSGSGAPAATTSGGSAAPPAGSAAPPAGSAAPPAGSTAPPAASPPAGSTAPPAARPATAPATGQTASPAGAPAAPATAPPAPAPAATPSAPAPAAQPPETPASPPAAPATGAPAEKSGG
jgi:hypothetical protein